jgi:hypothetical protein
MASPAPISEARLNANRENAAQSTGPRTPEAKSRTRLNGLRHGLTGQTALLPEEDRAVYDRHHARFLAELRPAGLIETQLAHHIADDHWRLNRIQAIENNIFALGIEARAGDFHEDPESDAALAQADTYLERSRELNLLTLYESRINRSLRNRTKELAELQRERKAAEREAPQTPIQPYSKQPEQKSGGFGFSNPQTTPQPTAASATEIDLKPFPPGQAA